MSLSQNVLLENSVTYQVSCSVVSISGVFTVTAGAAFVGLVNSVGVNTASYLHAQATGVYALTFTESLGASVVIKEISVRSVKSFAQNYSVKEFLSGNSDEDKEIFFRADTQRLQLSKNFELFYTPIAIITKLQRGSLVKCFVALGDDDFYQLEGNAGKGTSITKVHSSEENDKETPPLTREIRISWRESSKQVCRLTQGGIISLPTNMDYTQ